MLNKKLAIFIFAIMLLVVLPVVSAVKIEYSPNDAGVADMNAHVEDTILFGLIQVGEMGTFELKSHKSPQEILKVGLGDQVVMYYDVNFKDAQSGALGDITFINLRNGEEVNRDWKFVYWGTKTYQIPIYECGNNTLTNGTIIQECSIIETQTEEREEWLDYNSKDLPKGKIRIGIMVNVQPGDYIDGIWEVEGKKIDKHASWTPSLETSLWNWYEFEEASGSLISETGTLNGTADGSLNYRVDGIVNYAINFSGTGRFNFGAGSYSRSGDLSISAWVYLPSVLASESPIFVDWNASDKGAILWVNTAHQIRWIRGDGAGSEDELLSDPLPSNTWVHVVATRDGSTANIYINGALNKTEANTYNGGATSNVANIGGWTLASMYAKNPIDEFGIWTRVLNSTEVQILYNDGLGCTYQSCVASGPTVTLYSPEDAVTLNTQNINFIGSVTDKTPLNVSLILDGVYNETNTSGIQGNYSFNKIVSEGSHNWTIEGCSVEGCVTETVRTLTVDTTPFVEFIPPTLPNYANITSETIPMYVNVSTDYFFNISYDLYNVNGTSFNQYYETETFDYNFTNIPDAHYHYNVTVCTTTGKCNVTETRHINHDVTPPEINITSPVSSYDYLYVGETLDLNFTVTDALANVSACWYNYNGTNNSVACANGTLVSVPFVLENNNNNLTVYSNDTFGNVGSEFLSWTYKVLETSKEYNNETLEGTFENFKLYLTKGAGVNVQNVVLHYDGQTDTSSLFSSGSDVMAESELFIDDVSVDTNNTFYFTVTLGDATVFNTSSAVQLVKNIELDDCSSKPYLFLTLNLVDEANQSAISGEIEVYLSIINPDNYAEVLSFNDSYSSVSSKTFCSNIFLNESSFLLGAEIRYDSDNHSAEFYNIQRSDLALYPKNYTLYDLKDEDTTKFKLIYRGENLVGVEGAIIQLQRKYISEGVYKIVEAPLTSSDSTAVVHIDTNTNSYKATVVKDGELLNTFDNLVFICQSELTGECTLDLQDYIVPPNSVPLESIQDFSYTITSSLDNKTITIDYTVPSGTTSDIQVLATQKDIVGTDTICNTTVSSAGGSIECGYNESIQDSYISYNIYKDGVQIAQKSYIVKDDLRDDFGGDNYFILIIFTISLIFMAILSPEWIVLNAIISIIIGGVTWLVRGMDFVLGLGAIAWLLLGAIIIIIKMAQKEDQ